MPEYVGLNSSNLFEFDERLLRDHILADNSSGSGIEYDEYVVYKRGSGATTPSHGDLAEHQPQGTISHRFNQADIPGFEMLNLAFRQDYLVDQDGAFATSDQLDSSMTVHGRVRRVVCFRRGHSFDRVDGLSITSDDLTAMDLHPATLQYSRRTTTEGRFWSVDKSKSHNPRRDDFQELDEYDNRLEACRAQWAHPFVTPVVLLQVQFGRTEEAILENLLHVEILEQDVHNISGFEDPGLDDEKRLRWARYSSRGGSEDFMPGPMHMADLMERAHDVQKESMKLLDTVKWMERAVEILLQTGDELVEEMNVVEVETQVLDEFGAPTPLEKGDQAVLQRPRVSREPLREDWHEIEQYLEGLLRMCVALETNRGMAEARCRAQIDIIYSKMAQENNMLNARMAVSATRDSSSMTALAVITAVFLPGEYVSGLFGMSMFDWQASGEDASGRTNEGGGAPVAARDSLPVLSHLFWVYWATAIPLTLCVLIMWRIWWVRADRSFRRRLSRELSERRIWTKDGRPRDLEHSFWYDFFFLTAMGSFTNLTALQGNRQPYNPKFFIIQANMNNIDMEVTRVDPVVTYDDMVQRLERAEKQIDLQRLQIAVLEAQQAPIAPEVPATVLHELFSKLTYEINILALVLTGPVAVDTTDPRMAKGLGMLGEQWKEWIIDEATRCSVFEAFVWYEVAQYFGSQHRDIWAGKMGGAFKDVCKQLRTTLLKEADMRTLQHFALWRAQGAHMITQALGNDAATTTTMDWDNLTTVASELFAVLKTYLPAQDAANPDASVSHAATLHYRLLNVYSLAVRIDDVLLGSKNPMFLVYGRPKRFDAATMWPSVENAEATDETPVKFQISPSIKMKVQPEGGGGAVASVFITKAKVCI
ncbi:hypothetical protein HYQ44_012696 [Verticillium longisporum]|nr:hypothetical protein HYQ44_012696 [Verticillium longisporum]